MKKEKKYLEYNIEEKGNVYKQSSKYSYATCDAFFQLKRIQITEDASLELLMQYLTPGFVDNVNKMSANELVNRYGTHILTDIAIGGRLSFMYSSSILEETSSSQKKNKVKAGLELTLDKIGVSYKGEYSKEQATSLTQRNVENKIKISYRGGQGSGQSFTYDANGNNISTVINISTWESSINANNAALVGINKALPLYDLISDPTKKNQVKVAVDNYIYQKQLEMLKPLYLYHHTSIDDHITSDNGGIHLIDSKYKLNGIIGYVYEQQVSGTVPLYEFYFRKAQDHVTTTDGDLQKKFPKEFEKNDPWIKGYVYKFKQPETMQLYEYWSQGRKNHVTTTATSFPGFEIVNPGNHGYIINPSYVKDREVE